VLVFLNKKQTIPDPELRQAETKYTDETRQSQTAVMVISVHGD